MSQGDSNPRHPDLMEGTITNELPRQQQWSESNISYKGRSIDDFCLRKTSKPLVEYFIRGRHKNYSVIYLSQSYQLIPKDIRLNCSYFCILDNPSANETARMRKEVNVNKNHFLKATKELRS